jgi:hypothetical protein
MKLMKYPFMKTMPGNKFLNGRFMYLCRKPVTRLKTSRLTGS